MQFIPFVPDITLTTIHGDEIKDEETRKAATLSQFRYFLDRVAHPMFVGKREGIEATEYILDARNELREQEQLAARRRGWYLEDERARSLQEVILRGPADARYAHNFYPFQVSMKDMKPAKKPVEETVVAAPTNGVAMDATAAPDQATTS